MPDVGILTNLTRAIDDRSRMNEVLSATGAYSRWLTGLLNGKLASLQDSKNLQSVFAICPRSGSVSHYFNKMAAFQQQRLIGTERNILSFGFSGNGNAIHPI